MNCPQCNVKMDALKESVPIEFENNLYYTDNVIVNVCPACGKRILGAARITATLDSIIPVDSPEKKVTMPEEMKEEPVAEPTEEKPAVGKPGLLSLLKTFASDAKKAVSEKLDEKALDTVKMSGSPYLMKKYEKHREKSAAADVKKKDQSRPIGRVVIDDVIFDPEACELFYEKDMPIFGNRVIKAYYYKTQIGTFVKVTKDAAKKDFTFQKIEESEVKKLLATDVDLYQKILGKTLSIYGTTDEKQLLEPVEPALETHYEDPAETEKEAIYVTDNASDTTSEPETAVNETETGEDDIYAQFDGQDQEPDLGDEYEDFNKVASDEGDESSADKQPGDPSDPVPAKKKRGRRKKKGNAPG